MNSNNQQGSNSTPNQGQQQQGNQQRPPAQGGQAAQQQGQARAPFQITQQQAQQLLRQFNYEREAAGTAGFQTPKGKEHIAKAERIRKILIEYNRRVQQGSPNASSGNNPTGNTATNSGATPNSTANVTTNTTTNTTNNADANASSTTNSQQNMQGRASPAVVNSNVASQQNIPGTRPGMGRVASNAGTSTPLNNNMSAQSPLPAANASPAPNAASSAAGNAQRQMTPTEVQRQRYQQVLRLAEQTRNQLREIFAKKNNPNTPQAELDELAAKEVDLKKRYESYGRYLQQVASTLNSNRTTAAPNTTSVPNANVPQQASQQQQQPQQQQPQRPLNAAGTPNPGNVQQIPPNQADQIAQQRIRAAQANAGDVQSGQLNPQQQAQLNAAQQQRIQQQQQQARAAAAARGQPQPMAPGVSQPVATEPGVSGAPGSARPNASQTPLSRQGNASAGTPSNWSPVTTANAVASVPTPAPTSVNSTANAVTNAGPNPIDENVSRSRFQNMIIPDTLKVSQPQPVTMRPNNRPSILGGNAINAPAISTPALVKAPVFEIEGERVLNKRKLKELIRTVADEGDGDVNIDGDVEDLLLDMADEFVTSVTTFACKLARHRKSDSVDVRDVQLNLERNWNIRLPGYATDEIRSVRKWIPSNTYTQKVNGVNISKSVNKNP